MRKLLGPVIWVPVTGIAIGAVLAHGALALDGAVPLEQVPGPLRFEADNARQALSAVAGSLVTVTAVIFWLWMVSVQLASKNASTRVIQQHFRGRFQELVLTFLAANFTYNVTVLRVVPPADAPDALTATPHLATSGGMLLTAATVMVILNAVNQAAERSQVDVLARSVRDATVASARSLAHGGDAPDAAEPDEPGHTVRAEVEGWVTHTDLDGLAEAVPEGGTVRLEVRANRFVLAGTPLLTAWPRVDADSARKAVTLERRAAVEADPDHGLRELVEIAEQSLPPGSGNTMAVHDVLAMLASALTAIAEHLPYSPHQRRRGRTLLRPHAQDWESYVHLAIDRVRALATDDPEVGESLVLTLQRVAERVSDPARREVVEEQIRDVRRCGAAPRRRAAPA